MIGGTCLSKRLRNTCREFKDGVSGFATHDVGRSLVALRVTCVALYARVSTCNGQDPEMQLSELREYACRSVLTQTRPHYERGKFDPVKPETEGRL